MSWKDRVRSTIEFESPDGDKHSAKWIGSNRTKQKKLGVFSYPKVNKDVVQDLDISSTRYPMTIYFDGADHDTSAQAFYDSCDQNGTWIVTHPIYGNLGLQLVSITEKAQPVTSANITEVDLEFIEPITDDVVPTVEELAGEINAQVQTLDVSAIDQFVNKVKTASARAKAAIDKVVTTVQNAVDKVLGPISAIQAEVNSTVNAIQRGINDTLSAAIFKPLSLAGQIKELVKTPALAVNNVRSRLNSYSDLAQEIFGITDDDTGVVGLNVAVTKELPLMAVVSAVGISSITGKLETRAQAIEAAELVADLFSDITDNLDVSQTNLEGQFIDGQYFSLSESYSDASRLVGLITAYLLKASADLKVEKKITLQKNTTPFEVVVKEYGNLGENDSNLDFFIETNKLKADEILVMPAGKEVVVYK